jgi:hypothetical protein
MASLQFTSQRLPKYLISGIDFCQPFNIGTRLLGSGDDKDGGSEDGGQKTEKKYAGMLVCWNAGIKDNRTNAGIQTLCWD